jgi:hypothetical protein
MVRPLDYEDKIRLPFCSETSLDNDALYRGFPEGDLTSDKMIRPKTNTSGDSDVNSDMNAEDMLRAFKLFATVNKSFAQDLRK